MIRYLIIGIVSLAGISLSGQGIHFTYFQFAPQAVNPALNGAFAGSYRATGIFRDQYQNTGVRGFRTLEVGVDAPIIRGIRKQDWVGVGLSIDQDRRGSFGLRDNYSRIGLSYHLSLDKKQTSILALGVQRISVTRSIRNDMMENATRFQLENGGGMDPDLQILQGNPNPSNPNQMNLENGFSDWAAGLTYTNKGKGSTLIMGISATHFLTHRAAFNGNEDTPFKLVGFGQLVSKIGKQTTFEPAFLTQIRNDATEFTLQTLIGYRLKPDGDWTVRTGIGARTGTLSGEFLAGAEYKGFRAGFAFDIPINGYANASGFQNAIEFGVSYIGIIKKTPTPKPIILCPRL